MFKNVLKGGHNVKRQNVRCRYQVLSSMVKLMVNYQISFWDTKVDSRLPPPSFEKDDIFTQPHT